MVKKIATVVFVAVQFAVLYCALYVFWANFANTTKFAGFAAVFTAAYAVGSSSRKIADIYVSASRTQTGKRGMMDL